MAFQKAWSQMLLMGAITLVLGSFSGILNGQDSKVDFAKDIKPLLEAKCFSCHNEDNDEGGFRLDNRKVLFDRWVFAEEGRDSPIIDEYILSTDEDTMMPPPDKDNPENGGPLPQEEIDLLIRWIDEGAEWPEDVELVVLTQDATPGENEGDAAPKKGAKVHNPNPYNAVGSLHPAVIHLPIGLLIAAGIFALLGIRGNFVMSDCAYYCLWLGTIGAILACVSGWWYGPLENHGVVTSFNDLTDMENQLFWHRSGGLAVTVFAFLLALFAAGARNRDPDDGFLWKLGLIVLAAAIGWVGHEGGKLTHGKKLYRDLFGVAEAVTGWDVDGNGVVDQWGDDSKDDDADDNMDPKKEDSENDDAENDDADNKSEVGKTSDENET